MSQAITMKHNAKATVFTDLFTIPKFQLQLYRALHPEDTSIRKSHLKTVTHKCVVAKHLYNDLGFMVRDTLLLVVEAQSTVTPNIIIRVVLYAVQLLVDYFDKNGVNLYASIKAVCPKIELYVIQTGEHRKRPPTLNFREEFFPNEAAIDLDATVHILYANDYEENIIQEYIAFCTIRDAQRKLFGDDHPQEALEETFRICEELGILTEYLNERKNEIMDINTLLFDQDYVTQQVQKAIREEGERDGEKRGKREGKREIARNMLKENMDPGLVQRMTGISAKELERLRKAQ